MRKLLLATTAALALGTGAAYADLSTEAIMAMEQFAGASKIEIKRGATTTKVEAIIGNEKIEITFDNVTEEILKEESETLTDDELANELDGDDDDEGDDDDDEGDDDDEDDDEDEDEDEDEDDDEGDDSDDDED